VSPVDPKNVVIAFSAEPNQGDVRRLHVIRSTDGGLTWGTSVNVVGALSNLENCSIEFDPLGRCHIVFDCNADNYVYWNFSEDGGTTWLPFPELANLGSSTLAAFVPSIAFDKNNNPHVAYGDGGSAGYWGDKSVYWTWRDMSQGLWMEVPPRQIQASTVGLPWPTILFDSKGVGHLWGDGIEGTRHVWYRQYKDGVWSDLTEIGPVGESGQTAMASCAVDKNDNLYVIYGDNSVPDGSGQPWEGFWDIFSGTNASGQWKYINLTADGPQPPQSYPDLANYVGEDGLVHLIYCEGTAPDIKVMHAVAYPWPPEPALSTSQISDTYNLQGPFTVTSVTSDLEGFVASCSLFVFVNGVKVTEMPMEEIVKDNWRATFTVTGQAGDVVSYYGRATDNEGYVKETAPKEFSLLAPSQPKADILLVHQNAQIDTFYKHILNKLGYVFEFWDYDAHNGIDESVTNFGWKTILFNGWVVDGIPTRGYEGNAFAAFLSSGTTDAPKNLLLASQDYFYGNGEPGSPTELTFNAGDFAYDFFQIGTGVSDPDQAANDSVIVGAAEDDPIAGSFVETAIILNTVLGRFMYGASGNPNWIDWLGATGQGQEIFFAANQGYCVGVSYDAGTFKTVNLPWLMDMVLDSVLIDTTWYGTPAPEAETLLQNIFNWFGTDKGEGVGVVKQTDATPRAYALEQNYPNPFNPETSIRFSLPKAAKVEVNVYNAVGQNIRTLVSTTLAAGSHAVVWDGLDDSGMRTASGVYFYSLKTDGFSKTMKMLMLK